MAVTEVPPPGSIAAEAEKEQQQPLPGTGEQLSLDAGGEAPTTSSITMRGGSLALEGQFNKGDRISLWVEVVVGEVHLVDRYDKFGNVIGTERRHVARSQKVQRA